MAVNYKYCEKINLHVENKISLCDAKRQDATAREIISRLSTQPGVILADEVGMGKTFVSLAVAASVALADNEKRPVVVMVPSALKEKWPDDFNVFRESCLSERTTNLTCAKAERAIDFLRLLDDEDEIRPSIIFLTHGALHRSLSDPWTRLALIRRAIRHRKNIETFKRALCRGMGVLLGMNSYGYPAEMWDSLLSTEPSEWLKILRRFDVDVNLYSSNGKADDPVPELVSSALKELGSEDLEKLFEALQKIPLRDSKYYEQNIKEARKAIKDEAKEVWKICLKKLSLRLPLLIFDEAHHLKNANTTLASLFYDIEAQEDAKEFQGVLSGAFERMLFLTATPFQLGHYELCSVLRRFGDISWTRQSAPDCGKTYYDSMICELQEKLDHAQKAAEGLDKAWGKLDRSYLTINGRAFSDDELDAWWAAIEDSFSADPRYKDVSDGLAGAAKALKNAEESLKPWVIRHLKPRNLSSNQAIERRERLSGKAIIDEQVEAGSTEGISIDRSSLLPFLLAARAAACNPEARPVFAEGLASSYEAFQNTRKSSREKGSDTSSGIDGNSALNTPEEKQVLDDVGGWYLDRLDEALQKGLSSEAHPKISATVSKVIELWRKGEKVLVFCHYVETGRVLRQYISKAVNREIELAGAKKLGCPESGVFDELEKIGERFFDKDSSVKKACLGEVEEILRSYPSLSGHKESLIELVRRFVRTPTFLIRYLPELKEEKINGNTIVTAFDVKDASDSTLRKVLEDFFRFLSDRCNSHEREVFIEKAKKVQTGSHLAQNVAGTYDPDEVDGEDILKLAPNVRLVNGSTGSETRQKLMKCFNTPFYPEIIIASSVMAEGVDLHLNCRHVIHHDLCWNPSTLEQRTGRVDRIGSKAERVGQSIKVYLPYIAGTQDEKMYRVVMDRERWFKVVMGEKLKTDSRSTEKMAERLPLPPSLADKLAFRLEVVVKEVPVTQEKLSELIDGDTLTV